MPEDLAKREPDEDGMHPIARAVGALRANTTGTSVLARIHAVGRGCENRVK